MTSDRRHECPITGCEKMVPLDMLMCGRHWFRVPTRLRNTIWQTVSAHGPAYYQAVKQAIAAVEEKERNQAGLISGGANA